MGAERSPKGLRTAQPVAPSTTGLGCGQRRVPAEGAITNLWITGSPYVGTNAQRSRTTEVHGLVDASGFAAGVRLSQANQTRKAMSEHGNRAALSQSGGSQ